MAEALLARLALLVNRLNLNERLIRTKCHEFQTVLVASKCFKKSY